MLTCIPGICIAKNEDEIGDLLEAGPACLSGISSGKQQRDPASNYKTGKN